jgi:hypothetical protein
MILHSKFNLLLCSLILKSQQWATSFIPQRISVHHSYRETVASNNNERRKTLLEGGQGYYDIEFQSDSSRYGRGEYHLSAALDERDIVVYQTGSWMVDGVLVGNGEETTFEYGIVDTIQVVWTHNCEHGYIRGMRVSINCEENTVHVIEPLEFIDFGPDQLYAREPVEWTSETKGNLLATVPECIHGTTRTGS